jgi:glyoxylase-like metal-dependent hydrolase (beta-lactamase superfamily II)
MYFRMLEDPARAAVTYLLADLERGEAVLIDPRPGDLPLLRAMLAEQHLAAVAVLRTHAHAAMPPAEDRARALGCAAAAPGDGALLSFGDQLLRVLATPGHTAGCTSYAWRDRIFCGDLLSVRECPDLPRPQCPQALWDSAQRLFRWPAETLLFPAHAPRGRGVSTVAEQRRSHPWLATPSRDECLRRIAADTACPATPAPTCQEVPA